MKPKELLEISPKGLVPGLKLNSYDPPRALNESTVIMDYLEECVFLVDSNILILRWIPLTPLFSTALRKRRLNIHSYPPLRNHVCSAFLIFDILAEIVPNSDARALVHLQSDHINRTLIPSFYRYLQAQETSAQIEGGKEFHESIKGLVTLFERAENENEGTAVGLWKEGGKLGWADVMAGPCMCTFLPFLALSSDRSGDETKLRKF